MTLVWTSGRPLGIPDRHNEDLFVGVRVEGFLSSVSVPLSNARECARRGQLAQVSVDA